MEECKELKRGDWIEVGIQVWTDVPELVEKVKVLGFNEEGVNVWNGVNPDKIWNIVWKDIDRIKKLKA